jgi:hypothetical protein
MTSKGNFHYVQSNSSQLNITWCLMSISFFTSIAYFHFTYFWEWSSTSRSIFRIFVSNQTSWWLDCDSLFFPRYLMTSICIYNTISINVKSNHPWGDGGYEICIRSNYPRILLLVVISNYPWGTFYTRVLLLVAIFHFLWNIFTLPTNLGLHINVIQNTYLFLVGIVMFLTSPLFHLRYQYPLEQSLQDCFLSFMRWWTNCSYQGCVSITFRCSTPLYHLIFSNISENWPSSFFLKLYLWKSIRVFLF